MDINDYYILQIHLDKNGNITSARCNEKYFDSHEEEKEYLMNRYLDIPKEMFSYKEVINRIIYHIDKRPVCPTCGNPVRFIGLKNKMYAGACSSSCAQLNPETQQKIQNTSLQRYGTKSPMQSSIIQQKTKDTCMEKYGVPYTWASQETKDKIKQTCLKKWGSELYVTSNDYHKKHDEIQQKIIKSKKANNSTNTSKTENEIIQFFNKNNVNYIYQYKSEVYPYNCDFYFPESNLYVEIQGTWTHGLKPYDKNDDFCKQLEKKWMSNDSLFYQNAYKNWTITDVKKRQTAIINNLNFLEIFSKDPDICISEIKKYLDNHISGYKSVFFV